MILNIKKLHPEATIPKQMTKGAAGLDLTAVRREIGPNGSYIKYYTGLAMAIPEGYEGQIRPRSSIGANTDLVLINSPGTIDADYRGEIVIIFKPIVPVAARTYKVGERVAQIVFNKIESPEIVIAAELDDTARGIGKEGSTGR